MLAWPYEDTDLHLMTVFNIVGYEAIKKLAGVVRSDVNKPLGPGLPSKLKIVGGQVLYGEHHSDHPLMQIDALNGKIGSVTGVAVRRADDGRIQATVSVISPYQQLAHLNKFAGVGDYDFFSSSEYISVDRENPTIFQNAIEGRLEPGHKVEILPGLPAQVLPIGFQFTVFTEATGFISDNAFEGVLSFDYHYQLIRGRPSGNLQIDHMIATMPLNANLQGSGTYKILVT